MVPLIVCMLIWILLYLTAITFMNSKAPERLLFTPKLKLRKSYQKVTFSVMSKLYAKAGTSAKKLRPREYAFQKLRGKQYVQ